MKQTKCDRCGAINDPYITYQIQAHWGYAYEDHGFCADLCPECAEKLKVWIYGEERANELQ